MDKTYEPIASTMLGSSAATVEFASLSGSFTDLLIVAEVGTTGANGNVQLQVNSDTGSNYSYTFLAGNGSSAYSGRYSNQVNIITDNYSYAGTGIESVYVWHLMSYANTNVYKTVLGSSANAGRAVNRTVGLWRSTNAITSTKFYFSGAETFKSGCTFAIYGIKAAA